MSFSGARQLLALARPLTSACLYCPCHALKIALSSRVLIFIASLVSKGIPAFAPPLCTISPFTTSSE